MYLYMSFVVVPVLITTGVTSRGEKDSEFEGDQVLDFRCSPGYCQKQSHTNKTKSIAGLELAGCVRCYTRKCCRLNVRNLSRRYDYRTDLTNYILVKYINSSI